MLLENAMEGVTYDFLDNSRGNNFYMDNQNNVRGNND